MMNNLLIQLDVFNKVKQAACFNKQDPTWRIGIKSSDPFMQLIGQAGRCFPIQPGGTLHICGIFAVIAAEAQFHAAANYMTLDRIMVRSDKKTIVVSLLE